MEIGPILALGKARQNDANENMPQGYYYYYMCFIECAMRAP